MEIPVNMSKVVYVDSASIGCLMDLYRQATQAGGALKLAGVQKRVETMLTMTGAQNFIELHPQTSLAPSRALRDDHAHDQDRLRRGSHARR